MWGDAAVTRYIGGRPFTPEEVWARLLRYTGHWCLLGFGFWLIEEKDTGAFAGEVGLAEFKRDIQPPLDVPEAGWVLASAAQGKGYATEALRAALEWARRPTACIIHPENLASLRVAEKCGYREEARILYKGQPTVLCRR
jgi:RimJ/RimL family protein N-acetyltransferase